MIVISQTNNCSRKNLIHTYQSTGIFQIIKLLIIIATISFTIIKRNYSIFQVAPFHILMLIDAITSLNNTIVSNKKYDLQHDEPN